MVTNTKGNLYRADFTVGEFIHGRTVRSIREILSMDVNMARENGILESSSQAKYI
jgi:hypothetical protein